MNLLFVEDDRALRYAVARGMRVRGHTVHEAESAREAMTLLTAHPIDVIVTDIGLPGMSGDVFAAEARGVRPDVRVVFATGQESIRDAGRGGGGPTVLLKPYSWEALEEAMQRGG